MSGTATKKATLMQSGSFWKGSFFHLVAWIIFWFLFTKIRYLFHLCKISFKQFQVTKNEQVHFGTTCLPSPKYNNQVIRVFGIHKAMLELRHAKKRLLATNTPRATAEKLNTSRSSKNQNTQKEITLQSLLNLDFPWGK